MDQAKVFRDLYQAQVNDLNKNRDDLQTAANAVDAARLVLELEERRFAELQAARRKMLVSTKGVLQVIREQEAAARAEAERAEDDQFI